MCISKNLSSPLVIGITGSIATGKTSLCTFFEEKHVKVIYCDILGHECYAPGEACVKLLVDKFGDSILLPDGGINRKVLGSFIWDHPENKKFLEDTVWTFIREKLDKKIKELQQEKVIIVEAAVLLEAGWEDAVDEVWLIDAPIEEQKKRLMIRNNLTEEEAYLRIRAQPSVEKRIGVLEERGCKYVLMENVAKDQKEFFELPNIKQNLDRVLSLL